MKFLDKKGLIKTIYCMMAVNGEITVEELEKFDELSEAIDGDLYKEYKDTFIDECSEYLDEYKDHEFFADIVMEYVDQIIEQSVIDDRLSTRFVVWNLFAIAYSDGSIDDNERRLIGHISRVVGMKKNVFAEIEMLMKASVDVQNELKWLETSSRPYSEIKVLVDELEVRHNTLMNAIKALIDDEVYDINTYGKVKEPKEKSATVKKIQETTSKITDTAGNVASDVGGKIKAGFLTTAKRIGEKSSSLIKKKKAGIQEETEPEDTVETEEDT